jgi:hypothetical protein
MTEIDQAGDERKISLGPVEKVIVGILVTLLTAGLISAIGVGFSIKESLARIDGSISLLGLRVEGQGTQIIDHESRIRFLERGK